MRSFLLWLDPLLVAPYRLLPQPEAAFALGTTVLALFCILSGLATLSLARRLHRTRLRVLEKDMRRYHELGEAALRHSGKDAFKAVNRQAHEAFGYHFSLSGAFFAASLWPVPLALAWMQLRFGETSPVLPFSLPLLGSRPGFVFWFLLFYIPLRMLLTRLMARVAPAPK